jgi:hypothetical protein
VVVTENSVTGAKENIISEFSHDKGHLPGLEVEEGRLVGHLTQARWKEQGQPMELELGSPNIRSHVSNPNGLE